MFSTEARPPVSYFTPESRFVQAVPRLASIGREAKLIQIDDDVTAARAASSATAERIFDLYRQKDHLLSERRRISEFAEQGGRRPDDIDRLAAFDAKIAAVEAEITRLKSIGEAQRAALEPLDTIKAACVDIVLDARGRLKAIKPPVVKLKPGENWAGAVEASRAERVAKLDEKSRIDNTPGPAADQVRLMRAEMDRLAASGAPDLDRRIRGRDPLKLNRHLAHPEMGALFLIWLFSDEIIERLTTFIGEDGPDTLTDADRAWRLAEIDAEILALERQEEAIIVAAAAQGQRIPRRPDANPLAVLEIAEA